MQGETLIAIKAPSGTTLEVPDPDEGMDFPNRRAPLSRNLPAARLAPPAALLAQPAARTNECTLSLTSAALHTADASAAAFARLLPLPSRRYQIFLKSNCGPIDVFLVSHLDEKTQVVGESGDGHGGAQRADGGGGGSGGGGRGGAADGSRGGAGCGGSSLADGQGGEAAQRSFACRCGRSLSDEAAPRHTTLRAESRSVAGTALLSSPLSPSTARPTGPRDRCARLPCFARTDCGLGHDLHGDTGALLRLSPLPSDPEFYFNHFDHPDGITDLFNTLPTGIPES